MKTEKETTNVEPRPLERPVRHFSVSPVFKICHAYQTGLWDGEQNETGKNAYPEKSNEHEAYQIGFEAGRENEA